MSRTILITGASRGIGRAMAEAAVARGDTVWAGVRDAGDAPEGAEAAVMDVTDPSSVAAAAGRISGPLDLLVCNAGVYRGRGSDMDAEGYDESAWQTTLMTNVAGPFFCVRAMLPLLKKAEEPKIAIISSLMASSEKAPGGSYSYRASKAAATNLARNLAADLKENGIAVGAYHPGWVVTDMGGPGADIDVRTSVEGLLQRFDALSMATTGVFEDYRGERVAF